jgi:hypoxanthine phosphoribosyltransferase
MQDTVLYTEKQILQRLSELAKEVAGEYAGKDLVLLGVLNGAFMLVSDFSKALWKEGFTSFRVDFVGVTSYGSGKESSRDPRLTKELSSDITGCEVLIIEDIIETGYSLQTLINLLESYRPNSIKILTLLDKKDKRETPIEPDYIGFAINSAVWVEGYGLDTDQKGRGCPDILAK